MTKWSRVKLREHGETRAVAWEALAAEPSAAGMRQQTSTYVPESGCYLVTARRAG